MSIDQEREWITGEELGREWRRLIKAGVPDEAPEFQALYRRVTERDEHLFELYGKPYLATDYGKWIAISIDGKVILRETAGELAWAATEQFGEGNFCSRKLAEFPGHEFRY